ncbi:MAG: hypothetical protein HC886_22690 [Leptolyngbyaceae cyanobacterium SM1_1_3]|nr:hypothetical protein [Leptolyngbyaceae cyanobacterium SM1_1_3]
MDYEHVHGWAAEFELSAALRQATAAAGGRAADVQLAIAVLRWLAVLGRWRAAVNGWCSPALGLEIAEGRLYVLRRDEAGQFFSVLARADEREVVRYDLKRLCWRLSFSDMASRPVLRA